MAAMRRWIALVLLAALTAWQLPAQAQARVYNQAELDALLAPVALYPDAVLSNILVASTYPDDVRQASEWSRANAQLTGEDAASTYLFNKHVIQHRFCANCGIHTHGEAPGPGGAQMAAINLRTLEDFDLESVPVKHYDGRAK